MDRVLENFCHFLEEYYENLQQSIWRTIHQYDGSENEKILQWNLRQEQIEVENLLDIFRTPRDKWQEGTEIFNDFDILSKYLLMANSNGKETSYIVFFLIEKNLATVAFRENSYIVDSRSIDRYLFKTMRTSEAKYLIQGGGLRELLDREKDLSLEEQKKKDEILEFIEKYSINVDDILEANQVVERHYLLKKDSFLEEDITKVVESLKYLKLNSKVVQEIQTFLENKYQKRVQRLYLKKQKQFVYHVEKKNTSEGKLLDDKEYKRLKRELQQYYEVYHNEVLQELDRDQVLYVLGLMIQLGYDTKEMKNFLLRWEDLSREINPISMFVSNYEKFLYYQDDYRMKEILEGLLEYASDIFMVDDSEYLWVKGEIGTYLDQANALLFGRYDYEIDCAKKLLKK